MNLKSMPVAKLMDLKGRVEAALRTKVVEQRRKLESELTKLTRVGPGFGRGHAGARSKVPPKYRNPDNPSETWAGRGLRPRWLAAALRTGKKLEHFSIAAPAKKGPAKKSRKTRK
jgi:DNA-binding protein H-NS